MSFNIDTDSLWIEYYSLIISTIFYIIYLKFTYFAKQSSSSKTLKSPESTQHHKTTLNSTNIINENTLNKKTEIDHIQTDNMNESEISAETINPNIDEMISSLNHKIQSIAPNVSKHNHKSNNNQQTANIDHLQQPQHYQTYRNHIEITNITASPQTPILNAIDFLDDIDSDDSLLSSPSPHSKIRAPQLLIKAHDELFALSKKIKTPLSNDRNTVADSPSTYYDTAIFDDESEYDSDTLNDYENMNKQLREDMKQTLFRINPLNSHCISSTHATPKLVTASSSSHSLFNYPSRTVSVSMSNLDVIKAPNQVISALDQLNQDTLRINPGERSQSNSPLNIQRYGLCISGESGSDFDHDRYIQENDFLLNEEWSSSDLNHKNEEGITHDLITPITHNISQCTEDQDDDFENDLKNCDVDLSQFPTEQECYPLY